MPGRRSRRSSRRGVEGAGAPSGCSLRHRRTRRCVGSPGGPISVSRPRSHGFEGLSFNPRARAPPDPVFRFPGGANECRMPAREGGGPVPNLGRNRERDRKSVRNLPEGCPPRTASRGGIPRPRSLENLRKPHPWPMRALWGVTKCGEGIPIFGGFRATSWRRRPILHDGQHDLRMLPGRHLQSLPPPAARVDPGHAARARRLALGSPSLPSRVHIDLPTPR